MARDICNCISCTRAALASCTHPRDSQDSSKVAAPVVAQRSATVPARDPAVAEMKRGPRIREAVDGGGDRHALRAEDEDQKRAHRIRYLTGGRAERQRGQVSRARQNSQRPGRRRRRRSPERSTTRLARTRAPARAGTRSPGGRGRWGAAGEEGANSAASRRHYKSRAGGAESARAKERDLHTDASTNTQTERRGASRRPGGSGAATDAGQHAERLAHR